MSRLTSTGQGQSQRERPLQSSFVPKILPLNVSGGFGTIYRFIVQRPCSAISWAFGGNHYPRLEANYGNNIGLTKFWAHRIEKEIH